MAHYAYTSPIRLPAAIVQAFSASPGVQSSEMLPKGLFIAIAVNLAFIALVTLGAILVARKDRSDATLFICIGAVTVIPLVAYTQFIGPIANVRFVIFLAPVWYLLAAMGADFLCKRCAGGARPSITTGAALLLAALISFPGLFAYVLYKDTIV